MTDIRQQVGVDHHPTWCALGDTCRDPDDPRHMGARTRWMPSLDDVQLSLELTRMDATQPASGTTLRGAERSTLTLFDTGSINTDGSPITASVDLAPADARHLADLLQRYADSCEQPAQDTDRRQIVIDGLGGAA